MNNGLNKRFLTGMAVIAVVSAYTGFSVFPDPQDTGSPPVANQSQASNPEFLDTELGDGEDPQSRRKTNPTTSAVNSNTTQRLTAQDEENLPPSSTEPEQSKKPRFAYATPAPTKPPVEEELDMPDWSRIFNPGGSLKDELNKYGRSGSNGIPDFVDLYSGIEAEFIQETISNGVATDSSALLTAGKLSDEVLYNGPVRAAHDLGNAYVLTTKGNDKHLRIYAGAERLKSDDGTYIEFEFNQNPVRLSFGAPWPIVGERVQGDLIVRMIFSNQALQSVEIEEWQFDGFRLIQKSPGITTSGCKSLPDLMYCVGDVPIIHPIEGFEVWDGNYESLPPLFANDFVEIGIDVDRILGSNINYASMLLRTPEDIALNSFRAFDSLAIHQRTFGLMREGLLIDGF